MSVATALGRAFRGAMVSMASALALAVAQDLYAQGMTTAAIRGLVTDESGQPIAGATILLAGQQTGQRYQTLTLASGRFYIANVNVGAYRIEARAIGFRPVRQDVTLALQQVADLTLRLAAAPVEVEGVTIAAADETPLLSAARTGPATAVSDTLVTRLPTLNRSFTDFFQTVPQVVGSGAGVSVAGSTARSNNIQIDGAVSNDVFALNATDGMPGGRSRARIVSVDAIREFQVQVAPYDVRFGGFTGGLLNAITRSGSNRFSGSAFAYLQSDSWVGKDSTGRRAADFSQSNYGFTLGGPIMRDRLHFFVSAESRADERPFGGPNIGPADTVAGGGTQGVHLGITQQTANAIRRFAIDSLGYDPGGFEGPTIANPAQNIFAKLDWQLGTNSHLEASYNFVNARSDELLHAPVTALNRFRDGYQLANSGYEFRTRTNGWRGKWTHGFGPRVSNELQVAGTSIREPRIIANRVPLIIVQGDRAGTAVTIGAERSSQQNILNQDILEITNNLTLNMGRHVFTVGTQNQFFTFFNNFFQQPFGAWSFADTLALQQRNPNGYTITLPFRTDTVAGTMCYGQYRINPNCGPLVEFNVQQLGFYAQDQFAASPRVNITVGLRLDVPIMERPNYNHMLDSISAGATAPCASATNCGGILTNDIPTGNIQLSPRLGVNYDVHGNGSFFLRGGLGLFTGRPPYVFVANAFGNTGSTQATLSCSNVGPPPVGAPARNIPVFTNNVDSMPTSCLGGAAVSPPASSVVFYDPDFKYPQNLRATLGMDHQLPWNMVGTVDLMYTKAVNQLYFNDINLVQGGHSVGEAHRPLYGTLSQTSFTTTPRRAFISTPNRFNDVIRHSNSDQDYQWSVTLQLQKRFSNGMEFSAGYNYSEAYDLFSFGSDVSNSNMGFSPLMGTLDDRTLAPSRFDIPHKVTFSGTANGPYGTVVSLIYVGQSGRPYSYTVNGDVNADGFGGNDLVYVPLNMQDISLCPATGACTNATATDAGQYALLDAFISSEQCLREARGRIIGRNTCREPWSSFVNARVSKGISFLNGQRVEVSADIRNLLALLGIGGQVRGATTFEAVNMLSSQGYNAAMGRDRYRFTPPIRNQVNVGASRWQLMFGAKYSF